MTVKKMFWNNPYLIETEAKIKSINGNIVTLDQTIVFAFSGGQQSDSGTIDNYNIVEAKKIDKEIYYTIDQNHCLKTGDNVLVKIDWEKRYKIMKLHFAAELILELIYQSYNKPEKIGANISVDKARVDFYWNGNISEIFTELLSKVNKLIDSNLEIISDFSDEENEKRCWEIVGFAKVPCGGTHLKMTGEIGSVSLKRVNIGSGKERIEIYLQS